MTIEDSPLIDHVEEGDIELVNGKHFKDAVLFPGGSHSWDCSSIGQDAEISVDEVMELLEHNADILVLSESKDGKIPVSLDTVKMLMNKGVTVYIRKTEKAVRIYNKLARRHKHVGAMIHS